MAAVIDSALARELAVLPPGKHISPLSGFALFRHGRWNGMIPKDFPPM
jgi:hypothetical protein